MFGKVHSQVAGVIVEIVGNEGLSSYDRYNSNQGAKSGLEVISQSYEKMMKTTRKSMKNEILSAT